MNRHHLIELTDSKDLSFCRGRKVPFKKATCQPALTRIVARDVAAGTIMSMDDVRHKGTENCSITVDTHKVVCQGEMGTELPDLTGAIGSAGVFHKEFAYSSFANLASSIAWGM